MPILVTSGVTTTRGLTFSNLLPTSVTASVSPSTTSVDEGSSVTFYVTTTGIQNGVTLYWTVNNISTTNPDFTTRSGTFGIAQSYGAFDVPISADALVEGPETFTVSVRTGSTSGTVIATSNTITINDPTYAFGTIPTSISEGSTGTFNVNTTNVVTGTTLYWTIANTSTTNADFNLVSGSFTINSNTGSFTISPNTDSFIEGYETFTVQIRTTSITGTVVATSNSVTVNDTSSTISASSIYSNVTSVDEGSSVPFQVITTGASSGTRLYWTVNNISTTNPDFTTRSGSFTAWNSGQNIGAFDVPISADALVEGPETFTVSVRTGSTSGTVIITSDPITINNI